MCGIAGIVNWPSGSGQGLTESIKSMTRTLAHRGPDGSGIYTDLESGVALGHRRLSILDLSTAADQPMRSENGRYCVVFNGEIYNFRDVARHLHTTPQTAARMRSSDTAVLAEAVSHWGVPKALEQLNGMFAFAVWDRQERELWLARDRFGEKPLYYALHKNALLFGSELPSITQALDERPSISEAACTQYLRHGFVPAPLSMFEGCWKLPQERG